MFETSSIRRDNKIHPFTLAIAALLHVAAIAAVTFVTVWDVAIPDDAPALKSWGFRWLPGLHRP